jgi:Arc/MetJ-type ribon-helix-helix transcriptional regulator
MIPIKEKAKYQGVGIPVPLIEEITDFVKKSKKYRSVSAFCQEAIRDKLEKTNGSNELIDVLSGIERQLKILNDKRFLDVRCFKNDELKY